MSIIRENTVFVIWLLTNQAVVLYCINIKKILAKDCCGRDRVYRRRRRGKSFKKDESLRQKDHNGTHLWRALQATQGVDLPTIGYKLSGTRTEETYRFLCPLLWTY